MKAVILAGGRGTRISEESLLKPKPMITIGEHPILWHIMKIYSAQGINDFVICLGYKGYVIKEYFANFVMHSADITVDCAKNQIEYHNAPNESWRVTLVDTGLDTDTGGRLKRVASYLGSEDSFCFTYGDGVGNIDIKAAIAMHKKTDTIATMTAAQPPGRYGALNIKGDFVSKFTEKPKGDGGWVNAGFFVLKPEVFNYIKSDSDSWEKTPLEALASENQLSVYKHSDFWHSMDTMRDKKVLEALWEGERPPWKVWP